MLPTAGVPFVAHQLAKLRSAGVTHVVLATSYKSDVFERGLDAEVTRGLSVDYVTEPVPLGTGGGIRNVADRLRSEPDEPLVVVNGDVLSAHDLRAQLALHRDTRAAVTLYLTEVDDPRPFGCVPLDPAGRVTAFLEKSPDPVTNRVNAGCYVFRRELIDQIPAGRPVSVERETFPALLAAGADLRGYVDTAYWMDIGTPRAFVQASCDLVSGRAASPALPGPPGESLVLAGASVAADAEVTGGACIGRGCVVEAGAAVVGAVLFDGAVVRSAARVSRSVLGVAAQVGDGSVVDDCVVGDEAAVGAGNELCGGLRLWPRARIADRSVRFSSDV
jgi:mannose-1-phosphate guanylyltransferase